MRDRGARDLTRAESSNLAAAKNLLFTSSEHDDRDLHSGALCKQDELELISCISSVCRRFTARALRVLVTVKSLPNRGALHESDFALSNGSRAFPLKGLGPKPQLPAFEDRGTLWGH